MINFSDPQWFLCVIENLSVFSIRFCNILVMWVLILLTYCWVHPVDT